MSREDRFQICGEAGGGVLGLAFDVSLLRTVGGVNRDRVLRRVYHPARLDAAVEVGLDFVHHFLIALRGREHGLFSLKRGSGSRRQAQF